MASPGGGGGGGVGKKKQSLALSPLQSLMHYLVSVGSAVPIPKALVANPLKERLSAPYFKGLTSGGGAPSLNVRDIVAAVITTWLWAQFRDSFERAFAIGGRIDVDPECKWLIHAAVDAAVRALTAELLESGALPLSSSSGGHKSVSGKGGGSGAAKLTEIRAACLASQALTKELFVDGETERVAANMEALVKHLDERRVEALRVKTQERTLIAALISRRLKMSESFSHAYTSSMVRAGEAFGHEDVCEIVQDEVAMASSLLPHDIFNDHTGAWEDPCRPESGYISGLTGDELTWRAHARALIQKSLKKLQERYGAKGGTPHAGPYRDTPSSGMPGSTTRPGDTLASGRGSIAKTPPSLQRSSSSLKPSSLKRKASAMEKAPNVICFDTGSAPTTSKTAIMAPNHYSSPLIWDCDAIENKPYGRHDYGVRKKPRAYSGARFGARGSESSRSPREGSSKRLRRSSSSNSGRLSPMVTIPRVSPKHKGRIQNTEEIKWADVAKMFYPVSLGSSDRSLASAKAAVLRSKAPSSGGGKVGAKIIAPFCRDFDESTLIESDGSDEESDEDLSEETILGRHQVVLDKMKLKLDDVMEKRQGRDRNRTGGR
uniref:Uncharacterized protein n=1 Tax=Odontella aurita TaxID=265563 RepID=A0A7S4N115_9STRA|mmetsp:Transcript_42586/g.129235  ORF Transcript_42586/g.129235 Transcript_42586/m.129235 type:complete len:604 (+) Transcript_42586:576-2387(+)